MIKKEIKPSIIEISTEEFKRVVNMLNGNEVKSPESQIIQRKEILAVIKRAEGTNDDLSPAVRI